jgi:ABC-type polysaccharide/polyol phosphate transport system ATPase subunit
VKPPGEVAVSVRGVTKRFKLYHNPVTGPVKEAVLFWRKRDFYEEAVAVRDVSFDVRRGEIVGIVGPNGSGKTTLLKMIAGLLRVSDGDIRVNGNVTALLALGVGVHPEMSGRENILYGGMLLGMSKAEVLRKTPTIIEFAELGEYIDHPFRTYSSGMKARLLFAISMSIDPDILIVDEALATGDAYFVQKSTRRIRELCESGATIFFVSHNLTQVEQLCERAFFLAEGRLLADGAPAEVIAEYNRWVFEKERRAPIVVDNQELRLVGGSGEVALTDVRLRTAGGGESTGFRAGEPMLVDLHYRSELPEGVEVDLFMGFMLSEGGSYVGEINTVNVVPSLGEPVRRQRIPLEREGIIRLTLDPLLLLNNHYALWIICYDRFKYFCEYKNVKPFFVARRTNALMRDALFWQPCQVTTIPSHEHSYSV